MLEITIVLTGVFDDVGIRHQARLFLYRPRPGIDLGVIDRNFRSPDVGWKNGWAKENGMSRILESSQAESEILKLDKSPSQIRNLKLDGVLARARVQFEISDFGFEMDFCPISKSLFESGENPGSFRFPPDQDLWI